MYHAIAWVPPGSEGYLDTIHPGSSLVQPQTAALEARTVRASCEHPCVIDGFGLSVHIPQCNLSSPCFHGDDGFPENSTSNTREPELPSAMAMSTDSAAQIPGMPGLSPLYTCHRFFPEPILFFLYSFVWVDRDLAMFFFDVWNSTSSVPLLVVTGLITYHLRTIRHRLPSKMSLPVLCSSLYPRRLVEFVICLISDSYLDYTY